MQCILHFLCHDNARIVSPAEGKNYVHRNLRIEGPAAALIWECLD